ncbi:hypothetical protein AB0903_04065 [Streptomyces sp. NPDC048389]|uniref:hypothetical protein n=1 Tax=Streptomyces sp. NPDC048389 TaxID=3154622 RepID=UPI0034569242
MELPVRREGDAAERRRGWDPCGEFEDMWSRMGRFPEQAAAPSAVGGVRMLPTLRVPKTEQEKRRKTEVGGRRRITGETTPPGQGADA